MQTCAYSLTRGEIETLRVTTMVMTKFEPMATKISTSEQTVNLSDSLTVTSTQIRTPSTTQSWTPGAKHLWMMSVNEKRLRYEQAAEKEKVDAAKQNKFADPSIVYMANLSLLQGP